MSASPQTAVAAESHIAEEQLLLEEQTLKKAKSLIYRAGTRRPTNLRKRRTEFRTKVNLKKVEHYIEVYLIMMVMIIIIQFNSILYYLCAEPTVTRPITDTAQCR
jgi:type IV secretory pathway VirB3-like protein